MSISNILEQELYDINCRLKDSFEREEKVTLDIHKQFEKERSTWLKRKESVINELKKKNNDSKQNYDEWE